MKKRILITSVFLALAMTACGNNGKTTSSTSSAISSGAITFNPEEYVTKLGEYKGLEYTKAPVDVTDAEIDAKVKAFLANYPEKITDGEVKKGDTVNIDYEGKKDGKAFEGGTAKGFNLGIGSGMFVPGFEEKIIGHKPGETFDIDVTFPKKYREGSDLNGAKVVFTIKLNYIAGKVPETLTDELVSANTEFKTADEYKANIKEELKAQKEEGTKMAAQAEVFPKIVTESAIKSVPDTLKQKYYNQFKSYYENMAASYGIKLKDLIKNQFKIDEAAFEKTANAYAENMGKQLIVVRMIAQKENLKVTDDEYKTALNTYYEKSGAKGNIELKDYEAKIGKSNIEDIVLADKVITFIMENGKAVEPKPAPAVAAPNTSADKKSSSAAETTSSEEKTSSSDKDTKK